MPTQKNDALRHEIDAAAEVLRKGGLILYPTDTVWGIGCDATNEEAVARIYALKRSHHIAAHMTHQTIGADKINMLRHVLFLQDLPHVKEHMAKHAALLRPKFELVLRMFEEQLREPGVAQWTNPRGGYFITCQVPEGCAKKVVRLCAEAGVILTDAGATHPYKKDPQDSAIRIAPSYPPIGELEEAMKVFCLCVRLAAVEKLLGC